MACQIEDRITTLRDWMRVFETMPHLPVDDLDLQIPLVARDSVERAGRAGDPDVVLFDRALLKHIEKLAPVCPWFEPGRQGRGWWWYLDEIQDGRRPRPEVG